MRVTACIVLVIEFKEMIMYKIKRDAFSGMWAVVDSRGDIYDMWDIKDCARGVAERLNRSLIEGLDY